MDQDHFFVITELQKKKKIDGTYSHAHTPYIREWSHIQNISILTFFPSGFDSDMLSFPQVVSMLYKEPTSTGRDGYELVS